MADLTSAFIGAVIGGSFSLIGTWLGLRGRPDYFDKMAMKHLSDRLKKNPKVPLEEIVNWGCTIGLTANETKQLKFIVEEKARRAD